MRIYKSTPVINLDDARVYFFCESRFILNLKRKISFFIKKELNKGLFLVNKVNSTKSPF